MKLKSEMYFINDLLGNKMAQICLFNKKLKVHQCFESNIVLNS